MNKRIIIGSLLSVSLLAVPVAAYARNGADDPAGHVRQEDRRLGRQEDKKVSVPTTPGTTNAVTTPAGAVLSQTSSNTTPAVEAATTLEEAITKAKALFADKTVAKTETEQEHGKTVYEIKFTDGSKVEIDAATGEVIESKDSAVKEDNSGRGSSHDDSDDDSDEDDHSGSNHN